MKNIFKEIRLRAGMSQDEFATALGTSVLSINRWENNKTQPNNMAQQQIYKFCKENTINVVDLIMKSKINSESSGKVILYHGSKTGIEGDILPLSRSQCDFGNGFYMGTNVLQPLTLVCSEKKPKFYTLELDLNGLKVLHVDIDMDWAMLIAYNRGEMETAKGSAIYDKYAKFLEGYDVVVGYIANDRMYTELTRFFNKTLTDVALVNCLSALDLGVQYVAITEKACKQIKVLKEETLSALELMALMDLSIERRKEGISLAEEVEVKYRREGRYFDEILNEG